MSSIPDLLEVPTHSLSPKYEGVPSSDAEVAKLYRSKLSKSMDRKNFCFFCIGISNLIGLDLQTEKMGYFMFRFISLNKPHMGRKDIADLLGLSKNIITNWENNIPPDARSIMYSSARIFPQYYDYLLGKIEETPTCFHTDKGVHPGKICP